MGILWAAYGCYSVYRVNGAGQYSNGFSIGAISLYWLHYERLAIECCMLLCLLLIMPIRPDLSTVITYSNRHFP